MAKYTKNESRDWARSTLKGHWSTLVTPFTSDNRLDESGLRSNISHIRKLGTTGAGCSWGMGEFWSLTREERLRVYEITQDESGGEWPVGAHVSHTSALEMLDLAKSAEKIGFDLLMVAAPYFVTKNEMQVIEWVRYLAEHTSLAVMFYNSPQFGIVMGVDGLREICSIPNVVGVKEASFNRELSIQVHLEIGDESIISVPDEWIFFKGNEAGFQQQVMFANTSDWRFDRVGRNHYVQFIERATLGDIDTTLYENHIRPVKQLSDTWWQRTVNGLNGSLPVAMCKVWGEIMGMAGGSVRSPLPNLTLEEKTQLQNDLANLSQTIPTPGDCP